MQTNIGREQGKEIGEEIKLIRLICGKMKKGWATLKKMS